MRQATCEQSAVIPTEQRSDWVIEHLIALSEFARCRDLPGFEEKLMAATETLLEELHAKQAMPTAQAANPNSTVLQFAEAARAPRRNA